MKAITLWEPWATLVAYGYKKYETRSWSTHHRGPLLIHAAKRVPRRDDLAAPAIRQALAEIGIKLIGDFPFGCGICTVNLVDVARTDVIKAELNSNELPFGNYSPGWFAWHLTDVQRIKPIPLVGRQGLWKFSGCYGPDD